MQVKLEESTSDVESQFGAEEMKGKHITISTLVTPITGCPVEEHEPLDVEAAFSFDSVCSLGRDPSRFDSRCVQYSSPAAAVAAWNGWAVTALGLVPSRVDPGMDTIAVKRKRITDELRGSGVAAFGRSTKDGREQVFVKPELNPFLPTEPGAHGLLYTFSWRPTDPNAKDFRLFAKEPSLTLWTYLGEYRKVAMRELSREEWGIQAESVSCIRGCRDHVSATYSEWIAGEKKVGRDLGTAE